MLTLPWKRKDAGVQLAIVLSRPKRLDSACPLGKTAGERVDREHSLLLFVQEEVVIPKVAQLEARVRVQIHELQESEKNGVA